MNMTLRARMLDLLPVMLVFALVALFATFAVIRFVVADPVRVPTPAPTVGIDQPIGH